MKPELLMPAGDLEKAKIAYQFGADACYGSTSAFSMRTREIGFNYKTLKKAVDYAHSIKKKFFITCNVYPHEFDIKKIKLHIKKLISMKPDALIIADPGILQFALNEINRHSATPGVAVGDIEIHLSTQANTTNSETVKYWHKQGVKRFVLARELSLKEISEIKKNIPKSAVLEAFVHGAMCNSVSGRCNLSNYLSSRDANRGACVQPCRWKYSLVEEKRPNQYVPIEEDENGSYIFNSKDLNMIQHLNKLADAGIESFKVEGRNKSIYYCAVVARTYRKAIDDLKYSKKELETVTNRGYSTGFYFGSPSKKDINYKTSRPSSDWQFVGIVKKKLLLNRHPEFISGSQKIPKQVRNDKLYVVEVRNEIKKDSWVEIVTPNKIYRKKLTKLITPESEELSKANPNNLFVLTSKHLLPENSMLRIKRT